MPTYKINSKVLLTLAVALSVFSPSYGQDMLAPTQINAHYRDGVILNIDCYNGYVSYRGSKTRFQVNSPAAIACNRLTFPVPQQTSI